MNGYADAQTVCGSSFTPRGVNSKVSQPCYAWASNPKLIIVICSCLQASLGHPEKDQLQNLFLLKIWTNFHEHALLLRQIIRNDRPSFVHPPRPPRCKSKLKLERGSTHERRVPRIPHQSRMVGLVPSNGKYRLKMKWRRFELFAQFECPRKV